MTVGNLPSMFKKSIDEIFFLPLPAQFWIYTLGGTGGNFEIELRTEDFFCRHLKRDSVCSKFEDGTSEDLCHQTSQDWAAIFTLPRAALTVNLTLSNPVLSISRFSLNNVNLAQFHLYNSVPKIGCEH